MNTQELVAHIDQEIARLQHARELLAGSGETRRRGRPSGTGEKRTKKTGLSAAARQKISEAQKKAGLRRKSKSRRFNARV